MQIPGSASDNDVIVRSVSSSERDFSFREVVNVCFSSDDNDWIAVGVAHGVTAEKFVIVLELMLSKCPAAGLRSAPVIAVDSDVRLASTAARDKVTSRSTELGVDHQIENKVDGEV